jgi:hypothetical protein
MATLVGKKESLNGSREGILLSAVTVRGEMIV